jgi:hypothetical protein
VQQKRLALLARQRAQGRKQRRLLLGKLGKAVRTLVLGYLRFHRLHVGVIRPGGAAHHEIAAKKIHGAVVRYVEQKGREFRTRFIAGAGRDQSRPDFLK